MKKLISCLVQLNNDQLILLMWLLEKFVEEFQIKTKYIIGIANMYKRKYSKTDFEILTPIFFIFMNKISKWKSIKLKPIK